MVMLLAGAMVNFLGKHTFELAMLSWSESMQYVVICLAIHTHTHIRRMRLNISLPLTEHLLNFQWKKHTFVLV